MGAEERQQGLMWRGWSRQGSRDEVSPVLVLLVYRETSCALRQEGQSWESARAGCDWEFNWEGIESRGITSLSWSNTEPHILHNQLHTGATAQGRVLGTLSLTHFQDFLLLCGLLPFSERNYKSRQF